MSVADMKIGDVATVKYHSRNKPIPEGWEKIDDMTGHPLRCYCILIRKVGG